MNKFDKIENIYEKQKGYIESKFKKDNIIYAKFI